MTDNNNFCQYPSIGPSTLGEKFNPAKGCSDIVDNLPGPSKRWFLLDQTQQGTTFKGTALFWFFSY
jgi:hypothetical protein